MSYEDYLHFYRGTTICMYKEDYNRANLRAKQLNN